MIVEEVDIDALRQEGLSSFRSAVVERIKSGQRPDAEFIRLSLLKAMEPILRVVCGADAKTEDHVKVNVKTGVSPEGEALHYTQAEGVTQLGNTVVEFFMDQTEEGLKS